MYILIYVYRIHSMYVRYATYMAFTIHIYLYTYIHTHTNIHAYMYIYALGTYVTDLC